MLLGGQELLILHLLSSSERPADDPAERRGLQGVSEDFSCISASRFAWGRIRRKRRDVLLFASCGGRCRPIHAFITKASARRSMHAALNT